MLLQPGTFADKFHQTSQRCREKFHVINESFQKSLCNVMSNVVLFAYPIKLKMSRQGTELQKFYQRSYIVISQDFFNATKKILDKFSFHSHFKDFYFKLGSSLHPEDTLSNHTVYAKTECSLMCHELSKCVGFNYRAKPNKYVVNCQLSNKTHKRENDELKKLESGSFIKMCEQV